MKVPRLQYNSGDSDCLQFLCSGYFFPSGTAYLLSTIIDSEEMWCAFQVNAVYKIAEKPKLELLDLRM